MEWRVHRHFPTLLVTLPPLAKSLPRAIMGAVKPLPRKLTRRRTLVVLATVFMLIGSEPLAVRLIGRSRGFQQRAMLYSGFERASLDTLQSDLHWAETLRKKAEATSDRASATRWLERAEGFDRDAVTDQRLRAYYGQMSRKYERAASYPWLPVEPDPPAPE
jgi:hypothetical protein